MPYARCPNCGYLRGDRGQFARWGRIVAGLATAPGGAGRGKRIGEGRGKRLGVGRGNGGKAPLDPPQDVGGQDSAPQDVVGQDSQSKGRRIGSLVDLYPSSHVRALTKLTRKGLWYRMHHLNIIAHHVGTRAYLTAAQVRQVLAFNTRHLTY